MTFRFTILGSGSSGGVPRPALGWGACDPDNPRNRRRRTSLLVERRGGAGVTRVLVDTSPDLREQLLDAGVDWLDAVLFTHEHADHTHGIDDLRGLFIKRRRRVDVYLDEPTSRTLRTRFGYCFQSPPGSEYPPIVSEHRLEPGRSVVVDGDPVTRLSLRRPGLFLRPERLAGAERDRAGGDRGLDRGRSALPPASQPFQRRRCARLDRTDQAGARDPDQSPLRPRL
jgi:phosphoribosyl 1,2-cyclic phosphate phosphodiesterase